MVQIVSQFFLAHEVCTNHEHEDCLRPEAEAWSHRCCPSTNIQNLRCGAQLFPRTTTCPRSHELLESSQTNYLPSSQSTQSLLSSCASWGLSPPTSTRTRKTSIMPKLVRQSQGNHGIKLTPSWSRLVGGVYSLSLILSCSTSRPCITCVTVSSTPMCHPSSTTCARSRARYHEGEVEYRGPKVPHLFHGHSYHRTGFARHSGYEQTLSKPKGIQVRGNLLKKKNFYIFINGSFNPNGVNLRSNVSGGFGHKWRRHFMKRWRWRRK